MAKRIIYIFLLAFCVFGGDSVRPGLEGLERSVPGKEEAALIEGLKEPFLAGKDVKEALQCWFDGRLLSSKGDEAGALAKWREGMDKLADLPSLPRPVLGDFPDGEFEVAGMLKMASHPNVSARVVSWQVDKLQQYGVVMCPGKWEEGRGIRYPLLLYCHGAAFGLPNSFMNFLAELVEEGYVVVCPAMRGEPLFQYNFPVGGKAYKCEGEIENLDGEVSDCLSMISAAWKLAFVRSGEFAVLGHSFGAGVGLLAAARAGKSAKAVVSYDAWLVHPQRYCWDRMRRGPRNWDSWEDFCNQPVDAQLSGLMKRSIVHNAEKLECPLLLFMGGAYAGSVFHESHDTFVERLKALNKVFSYELIPGGGHNFVLYRRGKPALEALKIQRDFLKKHYPPLGAGQ